MFGFCIGGSLRGRGWKYGSGFVDGIFPVLSPIAQKILSFIQKESDPEKVADVLGTLPSTHASWDDLINVAVQLRLNKKWDSIILVSFLGKVPLLSSSFILYIRLAQGLIIIGTVLCFLKFLTV